MKGPGDAQLVVENACLRYGQLEVLNDLSLSVGSSEVVSIVGPSGCGKTTLLRCVGGLNQLNGGEIRIGMQRNEGRVQEDAGIDGLHDAVVGSAVRRGVHRLEPGELLIGFEARDVLPHRVEPVGDAGTGPVDAAVV